MTEADRLRFLDEFTSCMGRALDGLEKDRRFRTQNARIIRLFVDASVDEFKRGRAEPVKSKAVVGA